MGDILADLRKEITELANKQLVVGIFDEDVARYAAQNEFGTETIPQRSFLRSTLVEEQDNIAKVFKDAYNGDPSTALDSVGEYLKTKVQEKIQSGAFTPNDEDTIEAKGSSHPLIASGRMLRSIDYKVVEE